MLGRCPKRAVPHRELALCRHVCSSSLAVPAGPPWLPPAALLWIDAPPWRCRMVELMFEKYGAPALFLAKNAVSPPLPCACFPPRLSCYTPAISAPAPTPAAALCILFRTAPLLRVAA